MVIAVDGRALRCACAVGRGIAALDATTGARKWKHRYARSRSSPAVAGGLVYVGWFTVEGNVSALDAGTGALKWSYTAGASGVDSSPAVADGVVYVASSDYKMYAFSLP